MAKMNRKQSKINFDCFDNSYNLFLSSEQSSKIQMKQPFVEFNELFKSLQFIFFVNC